MFPDEFEMFAAPGSAASVSTSTKSLQKWTKKKMYGLDLSPVAGMLLQYKQFQAEQQAQQWRSGTYPEIAQIKKKDLLAAPVQIAVLDMQVVTAAELDLVETTAAFNFDRGGSVDRVVGWFSCRFARGGHLVTLDTGPAAPSTHWHQMAGVRALRSLCARLAIA